jgi:hypothetical protein
LPGIQGHGGAVVAFQRPERMAGGVGRTGAQLAPCRPGDRGRGVAFVRTPMALVRRWMHRAAGTAGGERASPEETAIASPTMAGPTGS